MPPDPLPNLPLFSGAGPSPGPDQVEVVGVVQRIVFASPDGEFSVIRLEAEGEPLPVSVIGALDHLSEGETVQVLGQWEKHPQYGRRLRAAQAVPRVPQTEVGIERYLTTLKGLGPESARRLVAAFGLKTLEVLEKETWRAAQTKGVGKRRAQRAAADAIARREEREVMVFLQGNGISAAYATRIRRAYGSAAMTRVRENPYRLARDVPGIGFQIADRIAQNMGIDRLSPLRIEAGLVYTLDNATAGGHCFLPRRELCLRAGSELRLDEAGPESPGAGAMLSQEHEADGGQGLVREALHSLGMQQALVLEGEDAYPPRLHRAEVGLAQHLVDLLGARRDRVPRIVDVGAEEIGGLRLAEGQRRALQMIETSPVCVITGGPGTGKTTIIRAVVQAWERAQQRVLLVAPTGRAAKRLSEATSRPASTVHRLLEWSPKEGFRRRDDRRLEADLLVCDEASMLDLPLARALVQALPRGATLLLVGDVDQLPSVGPGRVLHDVIESGVVPVARLRQIFRQAEGSGIVENAHRILGGEVPLSAPRGERMGEFYFIEAEEPAQAQDLIVRLVAERIPQRLGLDPVRDIQVLTPMHRGEVGTEELNRVLQAVLNPGAGATPALPAPGESNGQRGELKGRGRTYRQADKVMQIRNDYERDVWNGDVGVVTRVLPEEGELRVRFDEDREVSYDAEDLDQLELAYAVSVHKSQGSEYPVVVVPLLMQHYVLLRRNLLYTAVTRGKRLVVLVGTPRALRRAVREQGDLLRYTRLGERLRSIVAP